MQGECDDRQAEHQRTRYVAFEIRRLTHAVQDRNADIHQEEQDQERIGTEQILRVIARGAPQSRDREREQKAEHVEHPPGAKPGNGEHAEIENRVVREQRDVIAAARGHHDGSQKATCSADHSERQCILRDCKNRRSHCNDDEQRQRKTQRNQVEQTACGKHREIQPGDASALQQLRIHGAPVLQPPAHDQKRKGAECEPDEAQLDRKETVLRRVFRQERRAKEQDDDADARERIAAFEPANELVDPIIDGCGRQRRVGRKRRRRCRLCDIGDWLRDARISWSCNYGLGSSWKLRIRRPVEDRCLAWRGRQRLRARLWERRRCFVRVMFRLSGARRLLERVDAFALILDERAQMQDLPQQCTDQRADQKSRSTFVRAANHDGDEDGQCPCHSRRGRFLVRLHVQAPLSESPRSF